MATTTSPGYKLPERVQATSLESVKFSDGMLVTAEDLQAAAQFPAAMLQAILRSYFGCGIMCGLKLADPDSGSYELCIDHGMAIDCHGMPVELCSALSLDLSPEPCDPSNFPADVYVAMRRATSDESARGGCSCPTDAANHRLECSRTRHHTVVKAFWPEELLELRGLCGEGLDEILSPGGSKGGSRQGTAADHGSACECLKECPSCVPAAESWILLGKATIGESGILSVGGYDNRQYVKPIRCACQSESVPEPPTPQPPPPKGY